MDDSVAAIEYIVLAVLLGFIVMKLYSVLGRRTGHERQSQDPFTVRRDVETANGAKDDAADNVVPLPRAGADLDDDEPSPIQKVAPAGSDLARGLMDIQLVDRSFEPESFLEGAKGAYEMIVCAYAEGDRGTLRPLIDPEVMEGFEQAIAAREANEETMEFTFIGFTSAKLTEANLDDKVAEITVKFVSEVISVKKNSDGAIIEGDPNQVVRVTDNWTFARDTRSSDPIGNW